MHDIQLHRTAPSPCISQAAAKLQLESGVLQPSHMSQCADLLGLLAFGYKLESDSLCSHKHSCCERKCQHMPAPTNDSATTAAPSGTPRQQVQLRVSICPPYLQWVLSLSQS